MCFMIITRMDGEKTATKSQTRKTDRRQRKYNSILLKEQGINYSQNPTNHIMVCNAGLVNGTNESDLVELFSEYGPLESVIMLVGKSYSFITFLNIIDASAAFKNINGIKSLPRVNGPLYLIYSVSVPENKENTWDKLPSGLIIVEDFVTDVEEDLLLKSIDWTNSSEISGKSLLKHRRVKHYGFEFNYSNNNIDRSCPLSEKIPNECNLLFRKLKETGYDNIIPWIPDQLTVNEYTPGQGIPSHVDTHSAFESPILSLSLGSDVVMDFKHRNGQHIPVVLPRRSLLIMHEESRYDWSHGITPRKVDVVRSVDKGLCVKERSTRTSFTFRKIRTEPCSCSFPVTCDSQKLSTVDTLGTLEQVASRVEDLHVHTVYDKISSHFSETRSQMWPKVAHFVNSLPIGSFLVDVGCGNGKYFGSNKYIYEVGCDRCTKLNEVCNERGFEIFTSNCLQLPLKNQCADGIICIAVIHHLATYDRRLCAIKEMVRILRIGGKGLIYVWAKDQLKNRTLTSYLKQDRKNRRLNIESCDEANSCLDSLTSEINDNRNSNEFSLPVHQNRTQFKHDDLLVPWKLKSNEDIHFRYYHVFKEGELESMVSCIDNVKVLESYYDQGNWCIQIERIK